MTITDESFPQEFWQGVEEFNQKEFYACHDTLEALWMEAAAPERNFYQGILQIAVALYHLSNHNWRGAVTLLGEGMNRLQRYQPSYAEIDVAQLLVDSSELLTALQQAGPEKLADLLQQVDQAMNEGEATTTKGSSSALTLPTIIRISPTS